MARIRPITDDELRPFVEAMTTAFQERPDTAKIVDELRPIWDLQRTLGAFEADRIVGTFRSWPTELTVPGGASLPAAAIAAVTVLPTHRRQGILRALVSFEHRAIRERGEAVSALYASEFPIYGRFGYGNGCRWATWTLDAHRASFHPLADDGRLELRPATAETRDACHAIFETHRRRQPGEIRRRDVTWDFDFGLRPSAWGPGDDWKGWVVVHAAADATLDGYVRYHVEDHWELHQPRNRLIVDELIAVTDVAEASLWRYTAAVDWVATVSAERRSPTERLPWLLVDQRSAQLSEVSDGLWVRLHDLPRALEARTYAVEGTLILEAVDPEADGGRWRVRLDATPDGARCRPTTRRPDLTVDVGALGAAYLGGTRLSDAVMARGADEGRAGALARAERLFRTADEPWCSTFF